MRYQAYIEQRAIESAKYIIENDSTIRETARYIGVSKSTTHKDLKVRLKKMNRTLYENVCFVLDANWDEKHLRGGVATKEKYESLRE